MASSSVVSVAPMLEWTDRHCRYFFRLLTKNILLYTEMVTTGALLYGDKKRFLHFNQAEHPVALQLGGSDPKALAECAKYAADYGYDEVNLNVGCPSSRVQSGRFGACLMAEPKLVAECVGAMQSVVQIPVTVKTRIGIDQQDSYEGLHDFIKIVSGNGGCHHFIIHARKAWLQGLSPKENREIPPLRYEVVYQLKENFPDVTIVMNGGIKTLGDIQTHLEKVDGVMIGREAYHNSYFLSEVEQVLYSNMATKTREDVALEFMLYIKEQLKNNVPLYTMLRPIFGLFHGMPGARRWRRYLTECGREKSANENIILDALACMG